MHWITHTSDHRTRLISTLLFGLIFHCGWVIVSHMLRIWTMLVYMWVFFLSCSTPSWTEISTYTLHVTIRQLSQQHYPLLLCLCMQTLGRLVFASEVLYGMQYWLITIVYFHAHKLQLPDASQSKLYIYLVTLGD